MDSTNVIYADSVEGAVRALTALRQERKETSGNRPYWSQRALAKRLGWVQSQVSHYERGIVRPQWDSLFKWAKALEAELTMGFALKYESSKPPVEQQLGE